MLSSKWKGAGSIEANWRCIFHSIESSIEAVFLTGQGGLPDGLDGLRWSSPVHSFWWTAMTQSGIPSGLDGLVQISVDWVGLQSRLT
jgi:hypothetical protein